MYDPSDMDHVRQSTAGLPAPVPTHPLRAKLSWTLIRRLIRYSATSAVALGFSEATLLIIVATKLTGATVAAAIANLVGVVPSYLLSRYWIWPEADRRRTGLQVAQYWTISIISMLITSLATGFIAHHSPTRGSARVALVGLGFLAVNLVLWLAKYVAYQRVVFRRGEAARQPDAGLDAESLPELPELRDYVPPPVFSTNPPGVLSEGLPER